MWERSLLVLSGLSMLGSGFAATFWSTNGSAAVALVVCGTVSVYAGAADLEIASAKFGDKELSFRERMASLLADPNLEEATARKIAAQITAIPDDPIDVASSILSNHEAKVREALEILRDEGFDTANQREPSATEACDVVLPGPQGEVCVAVEIGLTLSRLSQLQAIAFAHDRQYLVLTVHDLDPVVGLQAAMSQSRGRVEIRPGVIGTPDPPLPAA